MAATQKRAAGTPAPHGTPTRYSHGSCRCQRCRAAKSRYDKARSMGYRATVPSHGVSRRLQALARMGWGLPQVEAETGIDLSTIRIWREGKWPTLNAQSAQIIYDLYERLWDKQGPSWRSRLAAEKRNWRPPMDWEGYLDMPVLPGGLHRETSEE